MKKLLNIILCMVLSTGFAMAQTKVTGTVLEDTGDGAIGANVVAQGTTVGTVTDFEGNFELVVPAGVKNLVISYMGFKTVTVPVKSVVKVKLESDAQLVEEVVVTGMYQQDKRLNTGATVKVDASSRLSGSDDISRSLAGVSGVQVQDVSGTFGAAPKIRIRGASSIYGASKPLWVIDGVIREDVIEMSSDDLTSGDASTLVASAVSGLNSEDIESIQVLKDGSATSIYGARAMAGVIVVTTKKAKAGHMRLNYSGEFSYRMKPNYQDYDICNSQEQMDIYTELENKGWLEASTLTGAKNSGVYGKMWELIKSPFVNGQFVGVLNTQAGRNAYLRQAEMRNTDWFNELFNNTIKQKHSVSIAAGTERAQVYASTSIMYDPGWYKKSGVSNFTGNVNGNFDILPKKLSLSIATNVSYRDQDAPGSSNRNADPLTGEYGRDFDLNPFSFALNTARTMDPKESYRRNYCSFNIFDELNQNYIQLKQIDAIFQGELSYKPVKGLEIKGMVAYRHSNTRTEYIVKDNSNQARAYRAGIDPEDATIRDRNEFLYTDPDNTAALPQTVLPYGGIYTEDTRTLKSLDMRGTIQYGTGLGADQKHYINVFAGLESNMTDRQRTWFRGWGYQYENGGVASFDYNIFKQLQEEGADYFTNGSSYYRNLAFFGNATYSYDSRYVINGTIRYEGTNKLGKSRKARWLPTWNVSGAWNASEEHWWRSTFGSNWNYANLKLSYSLTADRGPTWVTNSLPVFYSSNLWRPLASQTQSAIILSAIENSSLTYEKKHELNISLGLGFLNDRIHLDADYYMRNNFDLIGEVQTAGVGGTITKWANDAQMKSSGCEFTLSTTNVKIDKFRWNSELSLTYATNMITKLDARTQVADLTYGTGSALIGYPVNSLFSIRFAGLTDEGLPTFYFGKNSDGTDRLITPGNYGKLNMQSYDKVDISTLKNEGTIDPKFTGSFRNTFTIFKDLELSVFFTYQFGSVLRLNKLMYVYANDFSDITASSKTMKNRWIMPGDENTTNIPVIPSKRQYNNDSDLRYAYAAYNLSDQRVAKGDFIRLKEISLKYNLPKKYLERQTVQCVNSFSVKVSGTNLALLYADKKLNGQDPEYYNVGGVSSPVPRQFTLTLNLGF